MPEALYRKYRPTTFAEVAEQGHVVRTVMNQLAQGKVAHAYLFSGPRGVGKTTIARLLAKSLNCETRKAGESEACGKCQSCLDMKDGRMLDVVEIDAASQTKVEETRENIIESVRFSPSRGKFKVFIIDEVHMLSTASFNAILKTLEEPPAHAIFILATTELHKIPATIISRCQRFDFHRIPAKEMMERLSKISGEEGFEVADEVLASISRLSEGCLRDAESLLGQLFSLGEKKIGVQEASLILPATYLNVVAQIGEAVAKKDVKQALTLLNEAVENGASVKHLLDESIEYARGLLFASLGHIPEDAYDPGTLEKLKVTASGMKTVDAQRFVDLLLTARSRPTLGAFPQLPFEIALVEACREEAGASTVKAGLLTPPSAPTPQSVAPETAPAAKAGFKTPPVAKTYDDLPPSPVSPAIQAQQAYEAERAAEQARPHGDASLITLADLQEKWGRCCAYVGEKNVALPLVLRSAKPLAVNNGKVTIGFEYQFHVSAMQETKNIRLLIEAIEHILMAAPTEIELVVEKSKAEADPVSNFVEALGGQVI